MATKLNVNIRTLLVSCEELAKNEENFWRLKKFINSLDVMILELESLEADPNFSKIPNYRSRLEKLKVLTNYFGQSSPQLKQSVSDNANYGTAAITEIRQIQKGKKSADERRDLFDGDNSLRRRKFDESMDSHKMNEAVKYYTDAQEKLTEHMLSLTRNLKEQTETANRIIKKDTEIASSSTDMTENNIGSLKTETLKLENHSKNAWKCWMWIMIVFVIVVFIVMVLFMKIVKKKKY